jgi:hypothetical protein
LRLQSTNQLVDASSSWKPLKRFTMFCTRVEHLVETSLKRSVNGTSPYATAAQGGGFPRGCYLAAPFVTVEKLRQADGLRWKLVD